MHIQTIIEQLGFRPHEAKVYLSALGMGETTIVELAAKTKLPRTSVQVIVEKLHKDGLFNLYSKRGRRYFVAENPEKLLIGLKEREAALKNIMPELQGMRYDIAARPVVRLYSGPEEIKILMQDIIEAKHHVLGMMDWDRWQEFMGQEFLEDFIKDRSRHFLKIKLLLKHSPAASQLKNKDTKELRTTRFLPADSKLKNTNFIYANKVALIALNKRLPLGILIEDQDIAASQTLLFDTLWQASTER